MAQVYSRILHYSIGPESQGLRIELFLKRKLYSHPDLAWLKRTPGSVLRNGVPARLLDSLAAGDLLTITVTETQSSEGVLPAPLPLTLLYEDEDLVAVNKPAGMPTHPSHKNQQNSVASALAWYYGQKQLPFVFRCSNRLDEDTSGVLIAARHRIAGSILAVMSERRQISRRYLAVTAGCLTPASGTISAPLGRKNGPLLERTIDFENGESAVTHYRLLEHRENCSLASIRLETGRTHQIRAHMKYLGYPLLGDYLYYPDQTRIARQALHSYQMTLNHPITGKLLTFTAPLPPDMRIPFGWQTVDQTGMLKNC